jgi:ribonuclease HI
MAQVTIATDGSGTSSGPGGWAAVLRCGDQVKEISGSAPEATNNTMEITAAIMALRCLRQSCVVELTTDSEYLLKGITEWVPKWKQRGWRTFDGVPVKNRELWEALDAEASRHAVSWVWVAGHSGHPDNERADELAGAERRKLKGEPEPKKRKKKIFNLNGIDDEAIREALAQLPPEKFERLRSIVLA